MIVRSVSEPRRYATHIAIGSATSVSRIRIGIITVSVAGSRVANRLATDSLVAQLRPQSKVTICLR